MNRLLLIPIVLCLNYLPVSKLFAQANSIRFNQYIKSLRQITLPLSHSAKEPKWPYTSPYYDKKGFEKFKYPGTVRPLGILFHDSKHIVLVDLSIGDEGLVPFLVCYNNQGKRTDSMSPYQISGGDQGYEAVERLIVSKKRAISVADTTRTWKDDNNGNTISHSTKTTIGITYYHLSAQGKFTHKRIQLSNYNR